MTKELDPFERWMVKSNLETIDHNGGGQEQMADQVAIVEANGYPRVSAAIEKAWKEKQPQPL